MSNDTLGAPPKLGGKLISSSIQTRNNHTHPLTEVSNLVQPSQRLACSPGPDVLSKSSFTRSHNAVTEHPFPNQPLGKSLFLEDMTRPSHASITCTGARREGTACSTSCGGTPNTNPSTRTRQLCLLGREHIKHEELLTGHDDDAATPKFTKSSRKRDVFLMLMVSRKFQVEKLSEKLRSTLNYKVNHIIISMSFDLGNANGAQASLVQHVPDKQE